MIRPTRRDFLLTVLFLVALLVLLGLAGNSDRADAYLLPVRPPLPPAMPRVLERPCPGAPDALACYDPTRNVVYDRSGRDPYTISHELGHAADAQALDDSERAAYAVLVGDSGRPWRSQVSCDFAGSERCAGAEVVGTEEDFADSYAACRLRRLPIRSRRGETIIGGWESGYGFQPQTNVEQRRICTSIARWTQPNR